MTSALSVQTHCSACKEAIFWCITPRGFHVPLDVKDDPKAERRYSIAMGTELHPLPTAIKVASGGMSCHYETCPNVRKISASGGRGLIPG